MEGRRHPGRERGSSLFRREEGVKKFPKNWDILSPFWAGRAGIIRSMRKHTNNLCALDLGEHIGNFQSEHEVSVIAYVLLCACQLVLAVVLLVAAMSKLAYPQQFIAALRASVASASFVDPIAVIAVVFEVELASTLIFSTAWSLPLSFVGTFLLLGAFTGWLVLVYRRKLQVRCGCFGASHSNVNKGSILRNLILMGISVTGFFFALSTPSLLPSPSVGVLVVEFLLAVGIPPVLLRHQRSTHKMSLGFDESQ